MKFDLSQFNDLDMENVGDWPAQVKTVFAIVLAILVFVGGYYFFVDDAWASYEAEQNKEAQLRQDFTAKYQLAANLELYRKQLIEMEAQFAELLKMLPSQNEMPGLLDDLTFVATDSGLKIRSIDWDAENQREFYIEYPIRMSVEGGYHQLGKMVSGVAELPRIVSLHDFVIKREEKSGQLSMDLLAKTYRFKEGAEAGSANSKAKGKAK
ncbi:type 4a pilus biogenesis protein PilO [Shewanella avicenniae]|uniref:Type 4a pilus biogenesis protein PilO n=1 Tax=Shewanella avicenniae TaxID=2814294 RepID=A0ABX7QRE4_9GAMM|nr:type 4a pilus biogenesis protein PilO [Shewanella avicenniae]QSX34034.1 type 4a pilus biogenesis protein PilO [Shewanella avicenniae]